LVPVFVCGTQASSPAPSGDRGRCTGVVVANLVWLAIVRVVLRSEQGLWPTGGRTGAGPQCGRWGGPNLEIDNELGDRPRPTSPSDCFRGSQSQSTAMELRRFWVCWRPSLLLWILAVVTPKMSSGLVLVLQGSLRTPLYFFSFLGVPSAKCPSANMLTVPFYVYVLYSL
jgi:hypothetical protein